MISNPVTGVGCNKCDTQMLIYRIEQKTSYTHITTRTWIRCEKCRRAAVKEDRWEFMNSGVTHNDAERISGE